MSVSVIIPTYNSEKYLKKAVDSVLSQTYQDLELIIVDDGSVDNTRKLVESINDSRIKYIYQENAGPSAARNNGIINSTGDYIAFLDADDIWPFDKIEKQVNIINKYNDLALVHCGLEFILEGENIRYFKKFKNYSKNVLLKKLLIDYDNVIPYPSSVLLKKSLLNETGLFDTSIVCGEDWDLWIRLAQKGNFYCINELTVIKYTPISSITSTIKLEKTESDHITTLNKFFNNLDNSKELLNLKPKAFASIYYNLALAYFYRNNYGSDINQIIKLLRKSFDFSQFYFFVYTLKVQNLKFIIKLFVYLLKNLKIK